VLSSLKTFISLPVSSVFDSLPVNPSNGWLVGDLLLFAVYKNPSI
jgi:hypothetical protein